jgi:hypothetical protein
VKSTTEAWPSWVQKALQGVTYWIGHRRCLYRNYPLSEGALVAEVCNIIHAHLPDQFDLQCEVQYSKLIKRDERPTQLTERARVDLVVAEKRGEESIPKFIIEVKRASALRTQIDADLRRLAAVRQARPDVRTFLFLISEAHRPKRFVDEEGKSILGRHEILKSKGYFRVRRTWKAAYAFTKRERAQYACLIEIYPPFVPTSSLTRSRRKRRTGELRH